MSKGRYLKAAERACSRKSRFETAAAAEAFVERRYRAYRCVVCGGYHLTSGRGDRREEPVEPPRKELPGPKLGDLDWSAVLDPKPKVRKSPTPAPPQREGSLTSSPQPLSPGGASGFCAGPCGKDGRVLLVVDGRLLKSRKVAAEMRASLVEGVKVEIDDGDPPTVLRVVA